MPVRVKWHFASLSREEHIFVCEITCRWKFTGEMTGKMTAVNGPSSPLRQASGWWYIYLPIRSLTACTEVLNGKLMDWRFVCGSYKKRHVSSAVIASLWYLLSVSAISMRSPEMLILGSFLFGRQHSTYQMLTNATHVPRFMKNTVETSYRNSNLCCNIQQLCKLYQQILVNYSRELRQCFEATKCV